MNRAQSRSIRVLMSGEAGALDLRIVTTLTVNAGSTA